MGQSLGLARPIVCVSEILSAGFPARDKKARGK